MTKYIVKDLVGKAVLKTLDPQRATDRLKQSPGTYKLITIPEAR